MKRHIVPTLILTTLCVAACTKGDKAADTTVVPVATTVSPTTADSAAGAVTPNTPAVAVDPSQYTDANIIAAEETGDSLEVALGDWVKTSSASAPVKAFATLISSDHGKGLKAVQATATQLNITPAAPAGDTTVQAAQHFVDRIKTLNGADLDSAFINHAIADHQDDIKEAEAMKGAAKDPKVKALVEKSLPELHKHLDRAQALAKKTG